MARMTVIDKQTLGPLSDEITAGLKALGDKHGVKLTVGGGKFGDGWADLKLKVEILGADGGSCAPSSNPRIEGTYNHANNESQTPARTFHRRSTGNATSCY